MTLTESLIEYRVEKMIDRLDKQFLRGDLTVDEYKQQMQKITEWANSLLRQIFPA